MNLLDFITLMLLWRLLKIIYLHTVEPILDYEKSEIRRECKTRLRIKLLDLKMKRDLEKRKER